MTSRRDELNAYDYAKRRLVAQFLRPTPTGSEEHAPRPLRAVLPGVLVGAVGLAAFGAWGLFKPVAPREWAAPYAHIIVASSSTSRYVVLTTDGTPKLHPVLNMTSARLLVEDGQKKIVKVDDEVLDRSTLPRGATVGIPYAPDRLPDPDEAAEPRLWAACERAEQGGRSVQTAAFVLAGRDRAGIEGRSLLKGGQLLYVESADKGHARSVVDATGTAYPVRPGDPALLHQLVGPGQVPQRVSGAWLATLHKGDPIAFPRVPGNLGERIPVRDLPAADSRVGSVLVSSRPGRTSYYVVLPDGVAPVSHFVARLLLNSSQLLRLGQHGNARPVSATFAPRPQWRPYELWPEHAPEPEPANATQPAPSTSTAPPTSRARSTVCTVLRSVDRATGATTLGTWAGTEFPRPLPTGTTSAYVTPGSGQLIRQFTGTGPHLGPVFLVTDSGLRHTVQMKDHSEPGDTGHRDGPDRAAQPGRGQGSGQGSGQGQGQGQGQVKSAFELLGYSARSPAPVPAVWASLVPTGPRLSTGAAVQLQGS
ncbi:type VII secretion protein EccB [Streptomyces sp. NPDC054863]